MRTTQSRWLACAVALGLGVAVACSSNNGTGPSTPIDLSGNYTLLKLLLGGFLDAPGSTGTLGATADSVHANITIVSPDTSVVHDTTLNLTGSYVAKQAGGTDSIYIVINGLGTIPGTFTIGGSAKDTLALKIQTPGGAFTAIWHKN